MADKPTQIPDSTKALEDKIDKLSSSVDKLSHAVDKLKDKDADKKEGNKTTSRTVVSAALGAVGFKLGAIVGAKVGLVKIVTSKEKIMDGGADFLEKFVRKTSVPALVGGVIGGVLGAVVGWYRGDRIKEPGDLIKKPIESIGRIFGPKPKDLEETAHKAEAVQASDSKPLDKDNWQSRVSQPSPATAQLQR